MVTIDDGRLQSGEDGIQDLCCCCCCFVCRKWWQVSSCWCVRSRCSTMASRWAWRDWWTCSWAPRASASSRLSTTLSRWTVSDGGPSSLNSVFVKERRRFGGVVKPFRSLRGIIFVPHSQDFFENNWKFRSWMNVLSYDLNTLWKSNLVIWVERIQNFFTCIEKLTFSLFSIDELMKKCIC